MNKDTPVIELNHLVYKYSRPLDATAAGEGKSSSCGAAQISCCVPNHGFTSAGIVVGRSDLHMSLPGLFEIAVNCSAEFLTSPHRRRAEIMV